MRLQKNRAILYSMAVLHGMVFYGPIATLYRQAAGVNIFQIAQIEGISLALCVALELPWGVLADKIGYRRTMLICCGLYFVSKIIFWQANGYGLFLLERVILAVSMAGLSGVETSMLYLSSDRYKAQHVFGVYNNCSTVGLMAAAGVYTLWIGNNYRLAGLLTVISYGLAALLAFGLTEVRAPEGQTQNHAAVFRENVAQLFKNRRLMLLLVAVALLNETHQSITVFLNQLQYLKCGMTVRQIGFVYGGITIAGLLGVLSAKATLRLKHKPFGVMLYACCCIACVALAVTRSAVLSVAAVLALRVAFSLFQPLQTDLQNKAITSQHRATVLSVNAVLMEGVGISTNLLYGGIAKANLSLAMGCGALLCLIGLVLYVSSFRHGGVCAQAAPQPMGDTLAGQA